MGFGGQKNWGRQEIFLVSGAFAVGVVTLGAWESALFKNCSLSERSEFE
jgi:hypothetical protein